MLKLLRSITSEKAGVALLEFAIVFPVLFVLLFGGIEVGRNILITLKVEKAGYVLTDIVSQYTPATGARAPGEISAQVLTNEVYPLFTTIMGTVADETKQQVIFSAVRNDAGVLRLKWQQAGGGSLTDGVKSVVNGKTPQEMNAAIDRNSVVRFDDDAETKNFLRDVAPGETFLVGEVFYRYQPILRFILLGVTKLFGQENLFFLDERTIVKRMYFRPRAGEVVCLPPDFLYDECQLVPSLRSTTCSCTYSSSQRHTNCARNAALLHDYYLCPDSTTREQTSLDAAALAGCGASDYGTSIEEVSRTFLNGSCVNP